MTTSQSKPDSNTPPRMKPIDPVEWAKSMAQIAERSQKLVAEFMSKQGKNGASFNMGMGDPLNISSAFFDMTTKMMSNPANLWKAQMEFWQGYMNIWQNTTQRMMGKENIGPAIETSPSDRRFKDAAWQDNAIFDFIKQSYLLTARVIQKSVNEVEGLDDKTAKKVDFYTRQFVDAMSPSNFVLTNPEVLRTTIESSGQNLLKGLENMLQDLERGKGNLSIRMTDLQAFKVGENIAVTPGKVVYQNELMQLIQYTPSTAKVAKTPLIIIPPWINKFYILDLREKNSFVKWLVDQGHTVFMISWVNPGKELSTKGFDAYMTEGPLTAIDVVGQITGEKKVNVIGYCLGGTLLSCLLAYMKAKGDERVQTATYLATMVDFAECGELEVFIDEEQLAALEKRMKEKGYLEGYEMATTFNMLRANDLIWSFVVNNYLLGKEPFPFDLLYWNSDSTRMPASMHSFYLRNMYQKNLLVEPGGIILKGVKLDLRKIETPSYLVSTREDHISPWKSTYAGTQLYKGDVEFVLSGSGHIAGIVNHPDANKYQYWSNSKLAKTPDEWLRGAKETVGSWWPHWQKWVASYGATKVDAKERQPGKGKFKAIENAPGSYVKARVV
ncbi:MAG: PHA/PHB synthase family protein [Dongiaceae bacterium]